VQNEQSNPTGQEKPEVNTPPAIERVAWSVDYLDANDWLCRLTIESQSSKTLFQTAGKAIEHLASIGCRPADPSPHITAEFVAPNGYHANGPGHPAGLAPPPPGATAASPGPGAPVTPVTGMIGCGKMTVGQSQSGKTQLQFVTAIGTLRSTLPPARMISLLPDGWTEAHLIVGTEYNVQFNIHWEKSGKYKDIKRIVNA